MHSRVALVAVVAMVGAAGVASAQSSLRMQLLGHANDAVSGRGSYAAVWGYTAPDGTELAFIGHGQGTLVYDVTDPANMLSLGSIDGPTSPWREMQTWSHYAYIVSEGSEPGSRGVQIVDLSVPKQPLWIGNFDSTFVTAHTIHIADGYAYVNGTNNGLRILDLADPAHPRDVGGWNARYTHDCYVRGDRAYLANINNGGFTILDISNKAQPVEIGFTGYDGAATHNCWSDKSGDYLYTTDETASGHLRVWDVRNPRAVVQVNAWSASSLASIHNVVVHGDSAYISYYTEGVHVLDIAQPDMPRQVGYYDTYPGVSGGYNGAWGVYPFARNGNIYVSDIQSGLFVLEMTEDGEPLADFIVEAPDSPIVLPGQSQLWLWFDLFNHAGGTRTYDLNARNDAGWLIDVQPNIDVPNNGVEAVMVTLYVPEGLAAPARVDVELCAQQRFTSIERCAETRIAVAVALQAFSAESDGDAVSLQWTLARDADDGGHLELSRAVLADGDAPPAGFELRTRAALASGGYVDRDVVAGVEYLYRLAWVTAGGTRVLGETRVAVAAPSRSRLLGATPNPFNPVTRLRFELARAGDVEIAIHDVRGRLVRTLAAAALAPGEHALVWDGRDLHGAPQASGVYLYEVRSGAWTAHGRMTLTK